MAYPAGFPPRSVRVRETGIGLRSEARVESVVMASTCSMEVICWQSVAVGLFVSSLYSVLAGVFLAIVKIGEKLNVDLDND